MNVGPHGSSLGIKVLGATLEESNHYSERLIEQVDSIQQKFSDPLSGHRGPGRVRWLTSQHPEPGGRDDDPEIQKKAAISIAAAMKQFVAATEDIARNIPPFSTHSEGSDKPDQDE